MNCISLVSILTLQILKFGWVLCKVSANKIFQQICIKSFCIKSLLYNILFGFKAFWVSSWARNSFPARCSASKQFEFQSSSWLGIQVHLDNCLQNILNIDLRAGSKLNSSSIFGFNTLIFQKIFNFDKRAGLKFQVDILLQNMLNINLWAG